MNLDLNQLKTFYTLVKTQSYTASAKNLFVTQSAISHAIKKLEYIVGSSLVQKRGKKIILSEKGEIIYNSCEKIFSEINRTQEELSTSPNIDTIKFGATVEFGTTIFMRLISDFIKSNPNIHIDFHFSHNLISPLISNELDLIIDCKSHKNPTLKRITLFREKYVVVATSDFRKQNGITSLKDLEKATILSLDKESVWWNNFFRSISQKDRPKLINIMEINHIRGMINAAINSLGVAFIPEYCILKELQSKKLQNLFPKLEILEDRFCIYFKNKMNTSKNFLLLVDYLKNLDPEEFNPN